MSNVSDFRVGLAHEFCITAAKAGLTPNEIGQLTKWEMWLRELRQVIVGCSKIERKDGSQYKKGCVAMSNTSDFSVGLAHEFFIAAAKAGLTPGEIGQLTKNENLLGQFREVLDCRSKVEPIKELIYYDADPLTPDGWRVEEHQKCGSLFKWIPERIQLYSPRYQHKGHLISSDELSKRLARKFMLNANVLDHLLQYTQLIPKNWKRKELASCIYFAGTIYRRLQDNRLLVRYLFWRGGGEWDCDYHVWPECVFGSDSFVAVAPRTS